MSSPKEQVYTVMSILRVAGDTIAKVLPSIASDTRCDTTIFNSVLANLQKRAKK